MVIFNSYVKLPEGNLTNEAIASVAFRLDAHGLCLKNSWNGQSGHQRCEGCEKAISFPAPEVEIWIWLAPIAILEWKSPFLAKSWSFCSQWWHFLTFLVTASKCVKVAIFPVRGPEYNLDPQPLPLRRSDPTLKQKAGWCSGEPKNRHVPKKLRHKTLHLSSPWAIHQTIHRLQRDLRVSINGATCKSSCSKTMYCIYHIITLQRWFKRAESLAVVLVVPNPIGGWPGKIQVISRSFATLLWGPQLTILSPFQGQVRRHLPCQAQPGAIPCRWMMKQ